VRKLALVVLLALSPRGSAAEAPTDYGALAVELLARYLRVDTTVPPGNELLGAQFFKDVLEREGLEVQVDEFAPGRANLLARLPGNGKRAPLLLMNHMDVVPADPARWSIAPFSGLLKDGLLHGRGAQDMKGEGILQLMALVRLKREGVVLERDVLFLATADEEAGFLGALRALSPQGFLERLKSAEYSITEGGENPQGSDGAPQYFGIATGEKGPFWLKLRASGTPGHGSRPLSDSAPNRLVRALERLRQHKTRLELLPSVEVFLKDLARRQSGPKAVWLRDPQKALQDPTAAAALYDDRDVGPLLRNTISITVVRVGYKTNVIPGTAEAELDVRLLPGADEQAFLAELKGVINDESVLVEPLQGFRPPNQSPPDSELVSVARRVLQRHYPGVPVTTTLLSGATESVLVRPLGIKAYGFTPLVATPDEIASTHGDDERVQVEKLSRATQVFYEVVRELCGEPRRP
jgi:acetylornithine deacetylase/succinyl-diaminopimelate desuccinylase-like protein